MPFSIMYPLIPVLAVLMFPAGEFPETGLPTIDRNINNIIEYYSDETNFVDKFDNIVTEEFLIADLCDDPHYDEPEVSFDVSGYVFHQENIRFEQRLNHASYRLAGRAGSVLSNLQLDPEKKEIYMDVQNHISDPVRRRVLGSYNEKNLVTWHEQYQPQCTYTRFKYKVDRIVHQVLSRKFSSYSNFWEFTCEFFME